MSRICTIAITFLLAFVTLALAGGDESASLRAGNAFEQVPFVAPELGTKYTIGNPRAMDQRVTYTVDRVNGTTVHLYWEAGGKKDTAIYLAGLFFWSYNVDASFISSFDEAGKSLWPLTVGKSIEFSRTRTTKKGTVAFKEVIRVLSIEEISVAGRSIATLKVVNESYTESKGTWLSALTNTSWYVPGVGVVRSRMDPQKWTGLKGFH